jgi:CubicO group peptidase (beta-lactamase class C family)
MRLSFPGALVCIAFSLAGCGAAQEPAPSSAAPPDLAALDAYVEAALPAWKTPGLSIAIVHDGSVVHARGFGVREQGRAEPVDADTVFAIASMTKPFTAAAVGLLVAEGRLGWDDRVADRLPGFRMHDAAATADLRVRDLLSHRAGLDTWAGDLVWVGSKLDRDEVLRRVAFVEPGWSPRYRFGYSNLMFLAAGELIEAVTGRPWEDVVRERLLVPLGMKRTAVTARERAAMDNVAAPHMDVDGATKVLPQFSMDNCAPAGSMSSSASDLARWVLMQLEGGAVGGTTLIPAPVIAETRAAHTAIPLSDGHRRWVPYRHLQSYGLGWFLFDYRGRLVVAHDGGLPGTFSVMMLIPEERLGVVVLTNAETMITRAVAYRALDLYLGAPETDWSGDFLRLTAEAEAAAAGADEPAGPAAPPTLPLADYAGDYANALLGRAEVRLRDGALALSVPEHGDLECALAPRTGQIFRCAWADPIFDVSDVTFELVDGRPARLRFRVRPEFVDPLEYSFERAAPSP